MFIKVALRRFLGWTLRNSIGLELYWHKTACRLKLLFCWDDLMIKLLEDFEVRIKRENYLFNQMWDEPPEFFIGLVFFSGWMPHELNGKPRWSRRWISKKKSVIRVTPSWTIFYNRIRAYSKRVFHCGLSLKWLF